jgi:L-ascorbate metabolism protein UlaG (beta-lactamase superfamily)
MSTSTLYTLSPHTVVEPLVNSWSAWSTVIAPVAAAMHAANYQVPLLRSFLQNPQAHLDASNTPDLYGGAFAALPPSYVPEMAALLERTERVMQPHLALAKQINLFQRWLIDHARGLSLEAHYPRIPAALRGCTELVYDYWHRPSLRVLEPLLYRTELYQPELQSLRLFSLESDRARPYFLNTPRLVRDGQIEWPVRFADARVDELFRLDLHPRPEREIRDLLGVESDVDLAPFLSEAPPAAGQAWSGDTTRLRYFGHACVLIERAGQSVLVDPFVPAVPRGGGVPRFSFADLPAQIDYLLVTHNHLDHFCLETLFRLRHRTGCLVLPRNAGALYGDSSLKLMAQQVGFRQVVELDTFESLPLADGEIVAVPFFGEHADMAHSKTGYVVRAGSRRILFAADSDCLDPEVYKRVRQALGTIDTAFIGMESEGAPLSFAFGPLLPQKPTREQESSRRQHGCNAARGLQLCETLGVTEVYNYAMGLEPWLYYVLGITVDEGTAQWRESETMIRALGGRSISCERLSGRAELVLDDVPRAMVAV